MRKTARPCASCAEKRRQLADLRQFDPNDFDSVMGTLLVVVDGLRGLAVMAGDMAFEDDAGRECVVAISLREFVKRIDLCIDALNCGSCLVDVPPQEPV